MVVKTLAKKVECLEGTAFKKVGGIGICDDEIVLTCTRDRHESFSVSSSTVAVVDAQKKRTYGHSQLEQ